ncbi:protein NUCLEAR FUSION DEFECTIVE 6, chloroplastic/mitochondrial isoform X1 [Gossypium australe]|uniref:Protein NUCLEAR FUSION DEFECTIVE 6, chloroplastic/mitochondrial isoform X1 n=1 Tax=Gossypium australe TaxID=47621 RepID=A0A5B6WM48_9ROSI|nr:protein NUCLEAR FUSION DEFECTIVE 6, chloroplastic/mitochondrial isoform X1 [Gossypium australe]
MTSFCRSALMAASRSLSSRPKSLTLRTLTPKTISSPFSSPSTRTLPCASRIVSALGGVESMMPLHSAIASARLQSSIAVDSSFWSWLSQGSYFYYFFGFFPYFFLCINSHFCNPELLYDGLNDRDDILFLLWYSNVFKIMGFFLLMFLCDESVSPSIWF